MFLCRPLSWFGWCLAGLLVVAGCSSDGGPSSGLSLELVLEGGQSIDEVDWRITDPAAGDRLLKEGSIDTSASGSTASVEAYGLPPGGPYVIHLSATSEDGTTTCKGSTQFDIAIGFVTELHVMLQCKTDPDLGAVRVDTWINVCAQLDMVVVSSLDTSVGGSIEVSAMASDKDGDPMISYFWTATGGSIANPPAQSTTYTCEEEGIQFITITVSDAEHCMDGHTVEIECIGDGMGMGGAGGMGMGGAGGMGMGGAGGMGMGGAGGMGMGGAGGMGMGGAGGMGMGGAGGAPTCIPDGGAQWAGPVVNRPCGTGACGEMEVCVDGVCEASSLVFVSSRQSDGALGGPRGADMICADLAEAAGLGGYWFSWTSDLCTSPRKRFEKTTLPYRQLDGVTVASGWDRLTNRPMNEANLEGALYIDENGNTLESDAFCDVGANPPGCHAWTNTTLEGNVQLNNGCLGLTSNQGSGASLGSNVGALWTIFSGWTADRNFTCAIDNLRIYCFEQSVAEPIP
ncbi:MAG: hypothetical protein OEM15_11680 [Myxococcales bacterium]|nr:hypothetical protein [Myxococcales bacterium]